MYKIGQEIRVDCVKGFKNLSDKKGYVTDKKATNGKIKLKNGFNIDFGKDGVWRVAYDDQFQTVDRLVNKKFLLKGKITHHYERNNVNRITTITDNDGMVVSVQSVQLCGGHKYSVTYDVDNRSTVVTLNDGTVGIALCNKNDTFNVQTGHDIAYNRALIKQLQMEIDELTK
jgi:hypothetical protein